MTPQQIADKLAQQLQTGQFNAAAKLAKSAHKQFPREPHFANVAGTALANCDKGREALPYFVKAVQLMPDHEEYQNNLVHAYIVANQHDKARELGERYAAQRKNPLKVYELLLFSANLRSQRDRIIDIATRALDLLDGPARLGFLLPRATAYEELGAAKEAEADLEEARSLDPENPAVIDTTANFYLSQFRPEEALALVETALEKQNDLPALYITQAAALTAVGRIDDARTALYKTLDLAPNHRGALTQLAEIETPEALPELREKIRKALQSTPRGLNEWCRLMMSLGEIDFRLKNYSAAGKSFAKAREELAYLFKWHPENSEGNFKRVIDATPKGPAILRPEAAKSPRPLFVVGQPRSGTTLTEMVLAAHPDVASCGELGAATKAAQTFLKDDAPEFDPARFEETYRANLPPHAAGHVALADKMPGNYRYVGMILHGIPGARIIHLERDPRDVALSMWRKVFKAEGMRYTNDLAHMAIEANFYRRFMNHWKAEFPDQFLTITYDGLVGDIEGTSRAMAEYCGLEWCEAMMEPQKTKSTVRTASVTQVREGVHKRSVGGWRRMEDALKPFVEGLDPALWPELDLEQD
ncbi:tetratricopeptide repeat-containing sulfotransferase family protein [Shimia sp. FJ5]|uniref:tetratricopeptide repeat-containing sulfotransferase family protein n=1 Tax=Shimia sp. FJ5 TaxID=3079054 RepID=UPI002620B7A2|nr:tetratricopeptide repeat-containing sulfotransferase family protein [Shimia sp. FJ5]MDV4143719.1 sulfotransferase [Shimia sp. FJ5]